MSPRSARRSEKTSEARIAESVRDLGHGREELLAAAGLRSDRARPEDLPLCIAPIRRHGAAGPLEGPGRRFGYRRLHILLRREGIALNHKKLFRPGGRKRALGTRAPMALPQGQNQRWSLDLTATIVSMCLDREPIPSCCTSMPRWLKRNAD